MSTRAVVLLCALAVAAPSAAQTAPSFEPARLIESTPPSAPPMTPGQEVDVVLTLELDAAGRVARVSVAQSGGPAFDAAAVEAARTFVFTPALLDGKPVPAQLDYRTHFLGPPPPADKVRVGPREQPTLFGEIVGRGDRAPQANVKVIVDDNLRETTSDARGHFVIEGLPPGPHLVHLRGINIKAYDESVDVDPALPTRMSMFVDAKPRYVAHVRGRVALQDPIEQTISAEEIKHIAGTQGDTLKAVQNLPGVARPPFNGGLIAVWGSAPGDTRVYADGVYIPTLYHFGGLRSTINATLVQSLTLLPGGYDVEHGRGLGGVVEIETRDPRTDGFHGFLQMDLVDVSALLEGRITKNFSVAAAFRASWLEFFLPAFLDRTTQFDPKYWDYQLKLHFHASSRDNVDLFFFGSDDTLDVGVVDSNGGPWHQFEQKTYFHRGLIRWQHRFAGGSTLTITPSVGYDVPYGLKVTIGNGNYDNTSGQVGYSLRALYRLPLSHLLKFNMGLDFEGTRYTLDARQNAAGLYREGDTGDFLGYTAPDPSKAILTDHLLLFTNDVAPFIAMTLALFNQRLLIMPQFRLEMLSAFGAHVSSAWVLPEPRLAVRVRVSPKIALQGSIGVYHQAPDSQDLSTIFGNPKLTPELGIHYVVGIEANITSTLRLELQGFYKDLRNLAVRSTLPTDPPLVGGGIGRVYGGELLVRQEIWKNFFGWISYTLMRSERLDHPGDAWRPFQYDQTHILTILGSYKLPRGFQVGLRFRYVTGNPYTPVSRAYYDINSYSFVPIYGAPYSGRLPAFNQLDLRVDKTFTFNHWSMVLYLDVQNVYDASSAEGVTYSYDYKHPYYLNGLPFLPVLGLRGEF